jgi:hypothetical protein
MSDEIAPVNEEQIHQLTQQIVEKESPVSLIESSLSSFLNNAFQMAIVDDVVKKELQQELLRRKTDLKPSELIAALTSFHTNHNDMLSKLISPTMQLLTAAQQNEMAAKQKTDNPQYQQTNIRAINSIAPAEVLTGLSTLFQMVNTMKSPQEPTTE